MSRALAAVLLTGAWSIAGWMLCPGGAALAQSSYQQSNPGEEVVGPLPSPSYPEPRGQALRYLDVLLLAWGLALAGVLIHAVRRRVWLILLLAGALVYFGFYRGGCVCPIGAIQNVVYSIVNPAYTISIVVTAIFLLPIVAALLAGRVFCGGICPLGAVQDFIHRKAVRVPTWLDKTLRWGRWLYLGTAVYFVVGGVTLFGRELTVKPEFVICKYDPFVNLFRAVDFRVLFSRDWPAAFQFAGPWWLWMVTGLLLAGGVFIGRPYCRWLCPYGAILGVCSRVSLRAVTVMPDKCIDCDLCADACPFGAIERHAAARATCLACNRCYLSCPMERARRGMAALAVAPPPVQAPGVPPPVIERAPVRGRRLIPTEEVLDVSYIDQLIGVYGGDHEAALPMLQAIQSRHNYLPYPAMRRVVELTNLSMADLVGLATFYNHFRLAPIGQHLVKVCCGTACHVAGARRVMDSVRLYLGLTGEADTDAARRFTVQEVACMGCCSLAPVMQIDDVTFGHLTAQTAAKAVETFTPASHKRPARHEHVHAALDINGGVHEGGDS